VIRWTFSSTADESGVSPCLSIGIGFVALFHELPIVAIFLLTLRHE